MTESTLGDRLRFVIWLSALQLGTWTTKEFAAAIGKSEAQFPRWARESPRPDWSTIKDIASSVGVGALWLDDPKSPDAREPDLFAPWLEARREFAKKKKPVRAEPTPTRVSSRTAKKKPKAG